MDVIIISAFIALTFGALLIYFVLKLFWRMFWIEIIIEIGISGIKKTINSFNKLADSAKITAELMETFCQTYNKIKK